MKKLYFTSFSKVATICFLSILFYFKLSAQTNVSGNQSGIWDTAGSPYIITGTVTVPPGQTLTINPGVTVEFTTGPIQLAVQGTLKAIGTRTDSIYFFRTGDFAGNQSSPIINLEAISHNSMLQYVKADGLGQFYNSDLTYAILISSSSDTISNCTIQNTRGTAIGISETAKPIVNNNVITANSNFDIVLNPDELRNINGNNAMNVGLINNISIKLSDTLRAENNYYRLLTSLTIPTTITFIINPGVEVQFQAGTIQLDVQGTLKAVGTNGNNIKFFQNGAPSGNQSVHIFFETNSQSSVLQYATVDGLGFFYNNDLTPVILIQSSSCLVDNCFIQNTRGTAIQIKGAKPTISNNTFYNNANLDVVLDPDQIRNLFNNNSLNIGLTNNIAMGLNDTLTSSNLLYRLLSTLIIPKSKILTINAGVLLQIPTGTSQLNVQGTLITQGADGNYVHFVPLNDYAGNQVTPIIVDTSSENSLLSFLLVDRFGYYYNNGTTPTMLIKTSSCKIVNTIIQGSRGVAVEIMNSASPSFTQSCFTNNANGAILSTSGKPTFTNCNFSGNTSGINNTSTTDTIDARNCYWGDASGPLESTTNPTGVGDSVSNNVHYTPFSTVSFNCASPVMPLTLLNFQAAVLKSDVNCTWQTASEINTSHFIIQRSTNSLDFLDIGKVDADKNSSSIRNYQFIDKTPDFDVDYYRLKMLDIDGKFTYSPVRTVKFTDAQDFIVNPNPVQNILTVYTKQQGLTVQVFDGLGKNVLTKKINGTATSINFSSLAKGMYYLIAQKDGKSVFTKKILKQ